MAWLSLVRAITKGLNIEPNGISDITLHLGLQNNPAQQYADSFFFRQEMVNECSSLLNSRFPQAQDKPLGKCCQLGRALTNSHHGVDARDGKAPVLTTWELCEGSVWLYNYTASWKGVKNTALYPSILGLWLTWGVHVYLIVGHTIIMI